MSMRFGGPCCRSACASVLLSGLLTTSPARASVLMEQVAQWGGGGGVVACSGDLACIAMGRHMLTYSIADPDGLLLLGRSPLLDRHVSALAMTGTYAFVGDPGGVLRIFDITDPAQPIEVSTFLVGGNIGDIEIVGKLAVIAAGYYGVVVLNITDPLAPVLLGSLYYGQNAERVAVSGDYACITSGGGALAVVTISDPTAPALVTFFDTPGDPYAVAFADSFAFVADGGAGLTVLNVSDPYNPTLVTTWGAHIMDVVLGGEYAYVADCYGNLSILHISDPGTPTTVGNLTLDASIPHLALCDEHLAVVGYHRGHMVDVADPAKPRPQGSMYTTWWTDCVTVDRNYAYVLERYEDAVHIVDLSDPLAPQGLACIELDGPEAVVPVGNDRHMAIVTSAYDMLRIYDVSVPTQPVLAANISLWSSGREITCVADRAYVGTDEGLEIFDLSTPSSPARLGYFPLAGIEALCVDDAYVYAATQTIGLAVIDVFSPEFPVLVGQVSQGSSAYGVDILYPYAYVSTDLQDLLIVDITDPTEPDVLGTFGSPRVFRPVLAEHDGYVFLYDNSNLVIVSVDDPAAPLQAGGSQQWCYFTEIDFREHHLIAAAHTDGLMVYALTLPDLGDLNCDGTVGFGDVNPFVLALSQPAAYQNQYPTCSRNNGDLNFDGSLTVKDINRFVALLSQ